MLSFSTGLRNLIRGGMSWKEALANGHIALYSGLPTGADAAPSGTKLLVFTNNKATYANQPTQMIAKITFAGAGSTGVWHATAIGVGGATAATGIQLFGTAVTGSSASELATNVAAAINAYGNPLGITAEADVANVKIKCPIQVGALFNGLNIYVNAGAGTTAALNGAAAGAEDAEVGGAMDSGTGEYSTGAAGTSATAGLNFDESATDGKLVMKSGQVWSGDGIAAGTAQSFRFAAGGHSPDGASTTAVRFEGSVLTNGGDMPLSNTTTAIGATMTLNSFSITVPASGS